MSDDPYRRPPRQGWLRDSIRVQMHSPDFVAPNRAGPGESTIGVARWSVPLSASPSYPGLVGHRRRPGWRQRRLRALPRWVRIVNQACAVAAVILGAEAALFTWLAPSAVPAYSAVAGWLLPGVGLLFGLFIDHNRHAE